MISEKQKEILRYCQENGEITKQQAVELIGGCYYHNKSKHTGDVLTRMVKRGFLKREKRGLYKIRNLQGVKEEPFNPDQTKMKL